MQVSGLKILVVDDCETHRKAALAQLAEGNDLTVAASYESAYDLLTKNVYEESKDHGFDMVLVDLLMPAADISQGSRGMKYVGQEMPIGIFLVIYAAKFGAKHVGLYTDMNHHDHPASACLDMLSAGGEFPQIGGAKFCCAQDVESFKDDYVTKVSYWDCHESGASPGVNKVKDGFVDAKDWLSLAQNLLK